MPNKYDEVANEIVMIKWKTDTLFEIKKLISEAIKNAVEEAVEAQIKTDSRIAYSSLEHHSSDLHGNNYWTHCENVAEAIVTQKRES